MPKWFMPAAVLCGLMFAVVAGPDRQRAVRVDDGAGAEDFLLPHAVGVDVPARGDRVRRRERAVSLFGGDPRHDRLAWAAAELMVLFGVLTLVTGPLWARKAWGIWWQWDVRLTSSLMGWMVGVAYLLLRSTAGPAPTSWRPGWRCSAWPTCRSSTSR